MSCHICWKSQLVLRRYGWDPRRCPLRVIPLQPLLLTTLRSATGVVCDYSPHRSGHHQRYGLRTYRFGWSGGGVYRIGVAVIGAMMSVVGKSNTAESIWATYLLKNVQQTPVYIVYIRCAAICLSDFSLKARGQWARTKDSLWPGR